MSGQSVLTLDLRLCGVKGGGSRFGNERSEAGKLAVERTKQMHRAKLR